MYSILTDHFTFILRTRWVAFLTTPEPVCPDIEAWSEEDPKIADQAFLEE